MSDLTTVEMVEQLRLSVIGSDNGAAFDHAVADRIEELEAELADARQDIHHLKKYLGVPAHVEEWEE